jgi:hypothetical protein
MAAEHLLRQFGSSCGGSSSSRGWKAAGGDNGCSRSAAVHATVKAAAASAGGGVAITDLADRMQAVEGGGCHDKHLGAWWPMGLLRSTPTAGVLQYRQSKAAEHLAGLWRWRAAASVWLCKHATQIPSAWPNAMRPFRSLQL